MQANDEQHQQKPSLISLWLKCGAILLLLSLSVLVIACGPNNNTTTAADLGGPQVTVTIKMNNNASPTPTLPPYYCGAWVTNSTQPWGTGTIAVNAKFVQNNDGNPVGMANATGTATVTWGDLSSYTTTMRTTADGLVVFLFTVPNDPAIANRNNIVTVSFTSADGKATCKVDQNRAAFFTLITVSPTPTPMPTPNPNNNNNNNNNDNNNNNNNN